MPNGRFFEEFRIGETFETEGITMTEGLIIDYGLKYDPQPYHMDIEAAEDSIYGSLVASGFQVMALTFRLFRDIGIISGTNLGGTAADDIHWLKPVRPGDTLTARVEVIETTAARTRTDRGFVRFRYSTVNQNREVVMTMILNHVIARRGDGSE